MADAPSPDNYTKRTKRLWRPGLTAIRIGRWSALAGFLLVAVGVGALTDGGLGAPNPVLFWLGLVLGLPGGVVVWLGSRVPRA